MRFADNTTVEAAVCWLPDGRERAEDQVRAGRLAPEGLAQAGATQVPVADRLSAPEMAVLAGNRALARSGRDPRSLTMLLHSWIYHQGHDFWSPAHYVAHGVGASRAIPLGIQQMCHGGAVSLYTAALHLATTADGGVLVTTADRFQAPGFDRWTSDSHTVYGDGGTAAVLARSGRGLRLVAQAVHADSRMEAMYRGDAPFGAAPLEHGVPIDIRGTKKAFAAAGGMDLFKEVAPPAVTGILRSALRDAGLTADEPRIRCALLPRLGPATLDMTYVPALGELMPRVELVRSGADTGHLGAGDVIANLAWLIDNELLDPGEFGLVLAGGGGFTWSCLVVHRAADER